MLPLPASQADLANRQSLVALPLLVLTTYTDHAAGTVDEIFYWSNVPIHYPWAGGADVYFRDVLSAMSDLSLAMPYLSYPQAAINNEQHLGISIADLEIEGKRLYEQLAVDTNLGGATLEYAEILVNPDRMSEGSGGAWWDLRDLPGTEHTFRFRGELLRVESVTDGGAIEMSFRTRRPDVPLVELLDETRNDPRDFGAFLPLVYGEAKHIPCLNIDVGWRTTLAEALDKTGTGVKKVTDATGLPLAQDFVIVIGTEQIACTASDHDLHTITIATRGYDGSPKASHTAGDMLLEIPEDGITIGVAGLPCTAIRELTAANPFSGTLMKLPVNYEINLTDHAAISGKRICSFRITREELLTLAQDAYRSARMSVQPVYETTGSGSSPESDYPTDGSGSEAPTTGSHYGRWTDETTTGPNWPHWLGNISLPYPYKLTRPYAGHTGLDNTKDVTRWRGHLKIQVIDTPDPGYPTGVTMRLYNVDGHSNGTAVTVRSSTIGIFEADTDWEAPAPGTRMQNLADDGAYLTFVGWGSHNKNAEILEFWIEAETGVPGGFVDQVTAGEIQAAAIGYGWQFYADVAGAFVPYSFSEGFGFDVHSAWNVLAGVTSQVTGSDLPDSPAIKLTATETLRYSCDSDSGNWTPANATVGDDTSPKTEGAGSLEIKSTGASLASGTRQSLGGLNWSNLVFAIDVRPDNAGTSTILSETDGVRLRLSSDNNGNGNYEEWDFGTAAGLVNAFWSTILIDLGNRPTPSRNAGTFNPAAVRSIRITFNVPDVDQVADQIVNVDNIRTLAQTIRMQKNNASANLTSQDSRYAVWFKADELPAFSRELGEEIRVYFENTAGSGTTVPATRRELRISPAGLIEGEWVEIELEGIDFGSPAVNSISTIGVEFTLGNRVTQAGSGGIGNIGPPALTVDLLQVAAATNPNYTDAPGTLIDNMADIARHFLADHCGLGHGAIDATTFAAARSDLASNVYAGPITVYGWTIPDILAGLSFEGRGNIIPTERSSGTVYLYHSIEEAAGFYTWEGFTSPLTVGTDFLDLRAATRPLDEIATAMRAFYRWDAFLGVDASAMTAVARCDADQNDTPINIGYLTTAETIIGRRDANPLQFFLIQDETTAQDVLGHYIWAAIQHGAPIITLTLPHWLGYVLELGDFVGVATPWYPSAAFRVVAIGSSYLTGARQITGVSPT
jgi:hypothetical protein